MYYLRSTVRNLSPDKLREAQDRIVAGIKIHSRTGTFLVSEMALFENFDEIMELIGKGEIQVVDERNAIATEELKKAKAKWDEAKAPVVEPPPEPEPEPEPEPDPEPAPAEPDPDPEPDGNGDEENGYTKEDLEAMTKEELLELASELGIEDKVHHRDLKADLVRKIWKAL